jgi:hypothetical protein
MRQGANALRSKPARRVCPEQLTLERNAGTSSARPGAAHPEPAEHILPPNLLSPDLLSSYQSKISIDNLIRSAP